jgi:hypothetical protein
MEAKMKWFDNQKFLVLYSGVLTTTVAVALLSGFANVGGPKFDTITVQRINIVEPDGTLRMVLSNNARSPAIIMRGHEYPDFTGRRGSTEAGLLFYDAEGSESGGLSFGGRKDAQGNISRFGHLSFDRYDQDQMFTIDVRDNGARQVSSIQMIDRPSWSITEYLDLLERTQNLPEAERQAAIDEFMATHPGTTRFRTLLGNETHPDDPARNNSVLHFSDTEGRSRMLMGLIGTQDPTITLRDEGGNVIYQAPPAN